MADAVDVILKFVPTVAGAAATGVGTAFTAVWRFTKKLNKRLADLEEALKKIKIDLEASVKKEATERDSEDAILRALVKRVFLKEKTAREALEVRVASMEKAHDELNDAYINFTKEQQEQWQASLRTLGQIEGFLKAMLQKKSSTSGEFPGSKR